MKKTRLGFDSLSYNLEYFIGNCTCKLWFQVFNNLLYWALIISLINFLFNFLPVTRTSDEINHFKALSAYFLIKAHPSFPLSHCNAVHHCTFLSMFSSHNCCIMCHSLCSSYTVQKINFYPCIISWCISSFRWGLYAIIFGVHTTICICMYFISAI